MKCQRVSMLTGTPCDLEAGHDGKHVKTYHDPQRKEQQTYSVTWSDEADARVIDVEAERKQGT